MQIHCSLQMYMQKFQLKGERFGGGGGYFGRGRRGGFRGGISRQGDTCFKCGGTGHWAINCKGRGSKYQLMQTALTDHWLLGCTYNGICLKYTCGFYEDNLSLKTFLGT